MAVTEVMSKTLAEQVAARQREQSPFVEDGGKRFLRYDGFIITESRRGVVEVRFQWRGMHTFTISADADLRAGMNMHVHSIEGRNELRGI